MPSFLEQQQVYNMKNIIRDRESGNKLSSYDNETFLELVLQMRAVAICDRRINVRDNYLPVPRYEYIENEPYKRNS